jgi:hypothetical protein
MAKIMTSSRRTLRALMDFCLALRLNGSIRVSAFAEALADRFPPFAKVKRAS